MRRHRYRIFDITAPGCTQSTAPGGAYPPSTDRQQIRVRAQRRGFCRYITICPDTAFYLGRTCPLIGISIVLQLCAPIAAVRWAGTDIPVFRPTNTSRCAVWLFGISTVGDTPTIGVPWIHYR